MTEGNAQSSPTNGVRAPQPGPPSAPEEILWNTSLDALVLVDDDRRYLEVNEPATELLGASAAQLRLRRIEDFTPHEQRPRLMALWSAFERNGRLRGEFEVLQGRGSRVIIEYSARRDYRPGQHLIVARLLADDSGSPARVAAGRLAPHLTRRETEILHLAAEGRTGPEIAGLLMVSPSTVKTHLESAYRKLGARDRASAVAVAIRLGLIA